MNHTTAVKIIERLVPTINSTKDAEGTLLKFASDNNLAPAELERLGQVFNTAKTISHLSKSASRGGNYVVLNVDSLVDKYSTYSTKAPEQVKSASTSAVKAARNPYVLPNMWTADEQIKSANIVPVNELKDAFDKIAAKNDAKAAIEDEAEYMSMLGDMYLSHRDNIWKGMRKFAGYILDEPSIYASLQRDSVGYGGNKEALTNIAKWMGDNHTGVAYDVMPMEKLASVKISRDTTGRLGELNSLQDLIMEYKAAGELIKEAAELEEERRKVEEDEVPGTIPYVNNDIPDDTEPSGDNVAEQVGRTEHTPSGKGLFLDIKQEDSRSINNKTNGPAQNKGDLLPSWLKDRFTKVPSQNKIRKHKDNTADNLRRMLMLQRAILTDPILQEANPARVSSLYDTYAQGNPDIMADPNLMSFLLRESVQYDGVAPHTYSQLLDMDKSRQQALKERNNSVKERYTLD